MGSSGRKTKEKRESSLMNSMKQEKRAAIRSIDPRKITSAKSSSSKRVVISTKNLREDVKIETPLNVYF
jgi:aromatic ring-opening dioxygenase LigB subunit